MTASPDDDKARSLDLYLLKISPPTEAGRPAVLSYYFRLSPGDPMLKNEIEISVLDKGPPMVITGPVPDYMVDTLRRFYRIKVKDRTAILAKEEDAK